MMWAIFPILASVFYCSSAYFQKRLAGVALPKKKAGAYAIMHIPGFLLSIVAVLVIFGRSVAIMPLAMALGLILAGIINVIGSIYYYKCLQSGATIDITIISQLSPLVSIVLGILLLGQSVTLNQAIGIAIIMLASSLVVFGDSDKKNGKKLSIKPEMIGLCVINMFFSILSDIVFAKYIDGFTSNYKLFAQSFFYFQIGSLLASIITAIMCVSWRKSVKSVFLTGRKHGENMMLCGIENIAFLCAETLYKLGLILAPLVAMMTVIGKVAGLFASLFLNIVLGKLMPKKIKAKKMTSKMALRYVISASLIIVGVLVMN